MTTPTEEPCSILIIDDSPTAVRLLADMLKGVGHILVATSGEAGIEIARKKRPQLILLDVEMPSMDGYEVCQKIMTDPATCKASVIFVTAGSSAESEIKALEIGAVDFITKPLNYPVVMARVRLQLKLQQQAAALGALANRDGLTGLFNRRYFDENIEVEFQRHRRQGLSLALAFIDIDKFKAFNDRYGHPEGDTCLKKVAMCLNEATMRSGEFVARYGGEEFVAVLNYTSMDSAACYAAKILQNIQALNIPHLDGIGGITTISVGVSALIPGPSNSVHQLIEEADKALYASKSAGRNKVTTWAQIKEEMKCT